VSFREPPLGAAIVSLDHLGAHRFAAHSDAVMGPSRVLAGQRGAEAGDNPTRKAMGVKLSKRAVAGEVVPQRIEEVQCEA